MLPLIFAAALAAAPIAYPATVVSVIDGDTIKVTVAGWPAPFVPIDVRLKGVDTPEHVMPPAKAACEVKLGLAAQAYARTLLKPGDRVILVYKPGDRDKYDRLLAGVTVPNGSDLATLMIAARQGRAYDGGTKAKWC